MYLWGEVITNIGAKNPDAGLFVRDSGTPRAFATRENSQNRGV